MAYCTESDLVNAVSESTLIQLTDDSGSDVIDSDVIDWAINKADAYIDTYLRGNHTVPLSPVPDDIKQISIDISTFYLYGRRRSNDLPAIVAESLKMAKEMLKNIRDTELLIDDTTSYANTAGYYRLNKTSSDKVFNSDLLDQY